MPGISVRGIPRFVCAVVACGEGGDGPYGLPSRAKSEQCEDFDRRTAPDGAIESLN